MSITTFPIGKGVVRVTQHWAIFRATLYRKLLKQLRYNLVQLNRSVGTPIVQNLKSVQCGLPGETLKCEGVVSIFLIRKKERKKVFFFNTRTGHIVGPIFTHNISKDVFPLTLVPFLGYSCQFLFWPPFCPKNLNFGGPVMYFQWRT